ncbi:hypothetical protein IG631_05626 [Alternaria alternata]|nr:hypothetical protein IG631_05626 [Alternaria alternata]
MSGPRKSAQTEEYNRRAFLEVDTCLHFAQAWVRCCGCHPERLKISGNPVHRRIIATDRMGCATDASTTA